LWLILIKTLVFVAKRWTTHEGIISDIAKT
jgi:hypothetical protein